MRLQRRISLCYGTCMFFQKQESRLMVQDIGSLGNSRALLCKLRPALAQGPGIDSSLIGSETLIAEPSRSRHPTLFTCLPQ